jgi:type III pantothenate kinase
VRDRAGGFAAQTTLFSQRMSKHLLAPLLAIDAGNTRTKLALFAADNPEPAQLWIVPSGGIEAALRSVLAEIAVLVQEEGIRIGWASVAQVDALILPEMAFPVHVTRLTTASSMPVHVAYATPHTLGIDRLLAVVGARMQATGPVLVIDAGTALTYDVADAAGVYLGGGISPGIAMRYRALHTFTARLPQVDPVFGAVPVIGNSTEASIRSGVQNGILAEVEGIIAQYQTQVGPNLRVFLTGGDAVFFSDHLKSPTFADPHLVVKGIYHSLNA